MIRLVASLIAGLTLGGIYSLLALGLVFAFRATRVFNFAQGQMMLLPALIVGYMQLNGAPLSVSLPIALLTSAIVGALFYLLVLRRTVGLPLFMGIIATFGLAAILDGLIGITFKGKTYDIELPAVPQGTVEIGGLGVSQETLTVAVFSILLSLGIAAIIRFTHVGLMIRAAGQDAILASQSGINVRLLYVTSWAACSVLAAVGGIIYGSTNTVNESIISLGLAAIPAIVIGGMDSVEGCLVGGTFVGLLQGFTQTYLGGTYVDLLTYCMLLIVLLVFPQGLFGTKEVVRA